MSCHNIGRGLNVISEEVIQLYEEGQLSKEITTKLLYACRIGANWCDGIEEEAIKSVINKGYCGLCMEKSGKLSNVYENNGIPLKYYYSVFDEYDKEAVHFFLCPECREMVLSKFREKHHL